MKKQAKSIRFPHASQIREMLGLNSTKLPRDEQLFYFKGLAFILVSSDKAQVQALSEGRRNSRPHRLMVKCNVCDKSMSVGRFNQHQGIHGREGLSELSKWWISGGETEWCKERVVWKHGKPTAEKLGAEFAGVLKQWLTPLQFEEMRDRNANLEKYDRSCASHDFCDANMAMAIAMEQLGFYERELNLDDAEQTDLINAAWDYARSSGLIEAKKTEVTA